MLQWLNTYSAAVQAIAALCSLAVTVVLASLTARYVRLTKTLANAADEQLKLAREAQSDQRRSLVALVDRLVEGVQKISKDPKVPTYTELVEFSAITRDDLNILEFLCRQLGFSDHANAALVPLRGLLRLKEEVSAIDKFVGWMADERVRASYPVQVTAAVETLQALRAAALSRRDRLA